MNPKTSFLYLIKKSFNLGLSNIWRNKVLSLATIFVTGTILFIFNIILTINFITQDALLDLNKKIDITVYLKETTTVEQAKNIQNELGNLPEVENVSYTSKEEALKQLKSTHPELSISFEKYQLGNPLPASLNISTIRPEDHQTISNLLAQDSYKIYFSGIVSNNSRENTIISSVSQNLLRLSGFTRQVIFWLIITFVIGGTLIIINALHITIFTRKQEISVMKLVGASPWFIRSPFIIESIIYGIGAIIISFIMLLLLSQKIQIQETVLWNYYSGIHFLQIFLMELGVTIGLSIISSIIAIQKYLKKDLQD